MPQIEMVRQHPMSKAMFAPFQLGTILRETYKKSVVLSYKDLSLKNLRDPLNLETWWMRIDDIQLNKVGVDRIADMVLMTIIVITEGKDCNDKKT